MSDESLRELLKKKYLVHLDGLDAIEFSCIQPVINTIREHDQQSTQKQLDLLDEAIEYCSNLRYSEQREMILMFLVSLRQRIQEGE